MKRQTAVSIQGDMFIINGEPTYKGRTWNGHKVEGLLMNSRMVQGIFDDLNPATRQRWVYPDTGVWDPERNTDEFITAMPIWREHGLLASTINLQGGSPYGYTAIEQQVWLNSAITPQGDLLPAYLRRLARIIDQADALGMLVILGIFYFGQEKVLQDENAIQRAVDHTIEWVLDQGCTNVVIEINNESNVIYKQPILQPERVHELIEQAKSHTRGGRRLLVSTSFGGNFIPTPNVAAAADFILIHGNGVEDPHRIVEMVGQTRALPTYHPMPVLFNEDDHFNFDQPWNNLAAAVSAYAGWGYFDYRMAGEGINEGYQSVPVHWDISSGRKKGFFKLLKEITGYRRYNDVKEEVIK
jgi:hypothetical protein